MNPPRTLARDLESRRGERVRVCGWAQEVRAAGEGVFVVLRDRSGLARLALPRNAPEPVPESAIEATGMVSGSEGEVEVEVDGFDVTGPATTPLPIGEESPLDERLDWRYLDLRRPRNRVIFEVQTTAERAMRELWHEQGFIELHTPKLRPVPNKSGTQLFSIDHFGRRAYLAQSPQFYKQMAMAAGFERIFEVGPVFRPQREPTSRHDTEFTSVDIEMSWISSHDDLMSFEEEMLRRVVAAVADRHADDLARHFGVELVIPEKPFPRVSLAEAFEIIRQSGWNGRSPDGDVDAEGERRLAAHVARSRGHEFVWITDYPEATRPFYHMRCPGEEDATRSFDLLWKGLEITSGAQREHRHDVLRAQAEARGVPLEPIRFYLDFFRFGCPPHGGFGLGLTRMLMCMLEVDDVREVTYLFRGPDRITP